jgi:hypothetical protein
LTPSRAVNPGRKGEKMKVNYCGKEAQTRMIKNGWFLMLPESYTETPEELYDRLINSGYTQVKVYWCGTRIKGIHDYFAFVKR